jgi:putative ABC transport system permease protein
VPAYRGRLFSEADDRRGCGTGSVVISYGFWQTEFGGQDSAIGRTVIIGDKPFQVIGVTPPAFFGLEVGTSFDVALPICSRAVFNKAGERLDFWWLTVMGRVKPDWPLARAAEHLTTISPGMFETTTPPDYEASVREKYRKFRLTVSPAASGVSRLRQTYQRSLELLFGITAFVLLIACANLANLMLARATAKEREFAVRLAIGASRRRVIQSLLCESLLLAGAGAALSILLAQVFSEALVLFLSTQGNPIRLDLGIDWRVLLFTGSVAMLTCILFGLVPALRLSRTQPATAMKSGGRSLTGGRRQFSFQRVLIASQIAFSLVLLMGALLFARSFWNLMTFDAGFRQDGILFAVAEFSRLRLPEERIELFKRDLLQRVKEIPQVESVSTSTFAPLGGGAWSLGVRVPGAGAKQTWSRFTWISPDYFRTMQIPMLAGRDFNERDTRTSTKVLIVNETAARQFFGNANPVGRVIHSVAEPGYPEAIYEIVGLVRDTKYADLREPIQPVAFAPQTQHPEDAPWVRFIIRTATAQPQITAALRQTLAKVSPDISIVESRVFRQQVRESLVREQFMAYLAGFFGVLAALLSAIGLFGVVSYMVARRRNEIGIRLALGSSRRGVVMLIVREMTLVLAIGLAIGSAAALATARSATTLLFGLAPHDAPTLAASAILLAVTAFLASWLPAFRASGLDPMTALRDE